MRTFLSIDQPNGLSEEFKKGFNIGYEHGEDAYKKGLKFKTQKIIESLLTDFERGYLEGYELGYIEG